MSTHAKVLKTIRSIGAGLPGVKKMRRRTRLEAAKLQHEVDFAMLQRLIITLKRHVAAFEQLAHEENWAVRGEEVVWIGEGDPLEIIAAARRLSEPAVQPQGASQEADSAPDIEPVSGAV